MYQDNQEEIKRITKAYIKKIVQFRKRIEYKDPKVLERYKSYLQPKGFFDWLSFIFSENRAMRFRETSKVLEERTKNIKPLN